MYNTENTQKKYSKMLNEYIIQEHSWTNAGIAQNIIIKVYRVINQFRNGHSFR